MTRVALVALAVLAVPVTSLAQTRGAIAGAVRDPSGAVVPGVTVEAASPALIEKVRTAVTDRSGQYAIVDLPVGTYQVIFTLAGFSTLKRDGIELLANFTAPVNAELKVGAVAETVTVTAASPLVDVQGTITARAVTPDLIKAIPNGGTMYQLAAMMPGVTIIGGQDVGGALVPILAAQLASHGGAPNDEVQLLDGLRIGNLMGGSKTQFTLSPLLYDEVEVQLSGQAGDAVSLGVTSNAVPRSGGNAVQGTLQSNGSTPSLQVDNLTSRLQALGLTTTTRLNALYDLNGSIGGPVVKDRLWFYITGRYQTNQTLVASLYFPESPSPTPTNLVRVENTSAPGINSQFHWDNTSRLSAAITPKLRVTGFADVQHKWLPYFNISNLASPESVARIDLPSRLYQATATYTPTRRLLVEGGVNWQDASDTIAPRPGESNGGPGAMRVVEQGTTLASGQVIAPITYGPVGATTSDRPMHMIDYRAAMSFVTGTHTLKVGMDMQQGFRGRVGLNSANDIQYRTLGFALNQVTIFAPTGAYRTNLDYDTGVYAQDRWTRKRLTLSGALRLDLQKESYDSYTANPTLNTPNRPMTTYPGADVVSWKDLNPRFGVSYDVFGDGKTALKASAARGVAGETIGTADALNPAVAFATSTARTVTDSNHNNTPDCNLLNPLTNGECGPWLTPAFGGTVPITQQDPATLTGWNVRPWNWELSAGVQHEVIPRVSLGLAYYRRINGNFLVTDNTANTAADFKAFNLTVPNDSRLASAGQQLTFYDINPVLTSGLPFGTTANVTTFASNYGSMYQHWNGFDITMNARLQRSAIVEGGVTFGRQMTDNCNVVSKLPELLVTGSTISPLQYCHDETGRQPQYKMHGAYLLSWQSLRISGDFQSLPGPGRQAGVVYAQADVTTALGRVDSGGGSKTAITLAPNTVFGDRLNQLDLRLTRIFRAGKGTIDANLDFYNAFNSDAVVFENATYSGANGGAWLKPVQVLQGLIVKFGGRWDF